MLLLGTRTRARGHGTPPSSPRCLTRQQFPCRPLIFAATLDCVRCGSSRARQCCPLLLACAEKCAHAANSSCGAPCVCPAINDTRLATSLRLRRSHTHARAASTTGPVWSAPRANTAAVHAHMHTPPPRRHGARSYSAAAARATASGPLQLRACAPRSNAGGAVQCSRCLHAATCKAHAIHRFDDKGHCATLAVPALQRRATAVITRGQPANACGVPRARARALPARAAPCAQQKRTTERGWQLVAKTPHSMGSAIAYIHPNSAEQTQNGGRRHTPPRLHE